MTQKLQISLTSVNDEVRFHAAAPGKPPIVIDYYAPPGDKDSHTSLELFLASAARCLASAVKLMATRKLKKEISTMTVHADGTRREAHPTGFSRMTFALDRVSDTLTLTQLSTLVEIAEKQVCPVFAMVSDAVETEISATVSAPSAQPQTAHGGA